MDKTVISIRIFLANCKVPTALSFRFFIQMDNLADTADAFVPGNQA
jgi:hypothetical protein